MHALSQMMTAHPFACAWVIFAMGAWIAIYALTGGLRRRKGRATTRQV
jgi:hypothetical protein